ncbi:hypothetical protein JTE90_023624 [Oedothorax gibbosus]|uniref:Autophagy-related protein 16 domain-containing protein n=1 Tax=Oedothorax gibbosus TaxID=931172 RepID=A0AAV6U547_9ARAC|nr:hypothetical protein JTE90_023624 [Oedothorax gibbosus]
MEKYNYRSSIFKQLKKRNTRESSFKDIIKYSNKLLESVDYLQKANVPKILQTAVSEETISDDKYKIMYDNSRKELAECLIKTSSLAEQVIKLKDSLDEKNITITKQKSELEKAIVNLESERELCATLKAEMVNLKKILQDKADEFDALNITYSSIDNRKNDLEHENRKLQEQLLRFKEMGRKSSSSESFESVFSLNTSTGSGKSPQKFEKTEAEAKLLCTKLNFDASHFCPDVVLPANVKFEFEAHNREVNAVLWFPDSSFLFTGGADRRVKLWEMCDTDVKLIKSVCDCNMSVMSLDIDSEASLLVCASLDFASRIWTTSDFTLRHTLTGHSGKVTSSKFLKDSHKVVSGSADQSLKLWDVRRRVCTATYLSQSPVNDVISKDSNLIVSGHFDNKIRLWDMRSNSESSSFQCSGMATSLDAYSKNRNHVLVSELGSNSVKLFDLRTGKESLVMTSKDFVVGCNWTRAKFSPDGKYCCCGSKNGSVFVWDTSNGALVRELKAHKGNVISCSWSICGSHLATSDSDRKCIIWSK